MTMKYKDTYHELFAEQNRRKKQIAWLGKFLFGFVVATYLLALGSAWADDGTESSGASWAIKLFAVAIFILLVGGCYVSHKYTDEMNGGPKRRRQAKAAAEAASKAADSTVKIKLDVDTSDAVAAMDALSKKIAEAHKQCQGYQPPCKFDCLCHFEAKAETELAPGTVEYEKNLDEKAIRRFSGALDYLLHQGRQAGKQGWHNPEVCSRDNLADLMYRASFEGDVLKTATYLMMLHQRGVTNFKKLHDSKDRA